MDYSFFRINTQGCLFFQNIDKEIYDNHLINTDFIIFLEKLFEYKVVEVSFKSIIIFEKEEKSDCLCIQFNHFIDHLVNDFGREQIISEYLKILIPNNKC
jgi:hypothetical protein